MAERRAVALPSAGVSVDEVEAAQSCERFAKVHFGADLRLESPLGANSS